MTIEQHPITTREAWLALRRQDVTASSAGALLGVHPYVTAFALWAEKTGAVTPDGEITEAQERGLELEPIAVKRIQRQRPDWQVWQPNVYYRDADARLGATPDAFAIRPGDAPGFGVIQIKSVEPREFRKKWRSEDGTTEPPVWIVIQALVEAELVGASWAAVAALVISYGIKLELVEIPIHRGIIDRIRAETRAFWRAIDEGRTPEHDYNRDAALIEKLFNPTAPAPLDLRSDNALPELLDERDRIKDEISEREARRKAIKAELLAKLGDHGAAIAADGRLITAKHVDRAGYAVKPSRYVDVRVKAGP